MKYAIVEDEAVVNVIEWDGVDNDFANSFETQQLISIDERSGVSPGWTYVGGEFAAPELPDAPTPAAPRVVTMRQARLALLGAGKLNAVSVAIASLPSPQKDAALIEWEYAATVDRDSALMGLLGAALELNEADLDSLFSTAASL